MKKIFQKRYFISLLGLGVILWIGFLSTAYAAVQPKTFFVPLIPPGVANKYSSAAGDIAPQTNIRNVLTLTGYAQKLGYNVEVANTFTLPNGQQSISLTSLNQSNYPTFFNDLQNKIVQSGAERTILYLGGHGDPAARNGWSTISGNTDQFVQSINQMELLPGQKITLASTPCGSGNCPTVITGKNIDSQILASAPGAEGAYGTIEKALAKALENSSSDAVGIDSVVNASNKPKYDPSNPPKLFYKNQKNEPSTKECFIVTPAPVDNSDPGVHDTLNGIQFTSNSVSGYGKAAYTPADAEFESAPNKTIRLKTTTPYGRDLSDNISDALQRYTEVPNSQIKEVYLRLPSAAEAMSYAGRGYTINGIPVTPGPKKIHQPTSEGGIDYDEQCNPTKAKESAASSAAPVNPFGSGGSGGGGGSDLGGGLGGLQSLLPLLMSGLLGGGQQGQGQNPYGNNQGQYGAGYGNQQQNCAAQSTSPVCGKDGTTYNNACFANSLGGGIKNQGVCVQAIATTSPTPTPTAFNAAILTQVSRSNIPTALVSTVEGIVTTLLSGILNGTISVPETVVR